MSRAMAEVIVQMVLFFILGVAFWIFTIVGMLTFLTRQGYTDNLVTVLSSVWGGAFVWWILTFVRNATWSAVLDYVSQAHVLVPRSTPPWIVCRCGKPFPTEVAHSKHLAHKMDQVMDRSIRGRKR